MSATFVDGMPWRAERNSRRAEEKCRQVCCSSWRACNTECTECALPSPMPYLPGLQRSPIEFLGSPRRMLWAHEDHIEFSSATSTLSFFSTRESRKQLPRCSRQKILKKTKVTAIYSAAMKYYTLQRLETGTMGENKMWNMDECCRKSKLSTQDENTCLWLTLFCLCYTYLFL